MKRLTIKNLTLTCDGDVNPGQALEQAREALRQINLTFQRTPYPLAALIEGVDDITIDDVDLEDFPEEDEDDTSDRFCDSCGQAWEIHNDDGSCVKD
jgi:hypothetical protein